MKTQTFKSGENMVMSQEGHISLVFHQEDGRVKLLATTDSNTSDLIQGVTYVPREWFVKPAINLHEYAEAYADKWDTLPKSLTVTEDFKLIKIEW